MGAALTPINRSPDGNPSAPGLKNRNAPLAASGSARASNRFRATSAVMPLPFESIRKRFSEFGQFGIDDGLAIALVGVPTVIALVIVLGLEELGQRHDFGDDRIVPDFLLVEFRDQGLGD